MMALTSDLKEEKEEDMEKQMGWGLAD